MPIRKMQIDYLGQVSLLTIVLIVFSCTTTPQRLGMVPEWVINTLTEEGENYVFVASGMSPTLDLGVAERSAVQDLKDQVMSFLGMKMISTSNVVSKGSLNSYQVQVEQNIVSQAKAKISGLRIVERFPFKQEGKLTFYLKALYKKSDLDKEKARISALFAELDDATSKPEKAGDQLLASGEYMAAIDQYIAAAAAALGQGIENATIKLERNLLKAEGILSKISLNAQIEEQKTVVGRNFNRNFDVRVMYRLAEKEISLSDVPLRFNYKVKRNDRLIVTGHIIKTDHRGTASFTFPTPDAPAKDNLVVTLDVSSYLNKLAGAPRSLQSKIDVIEDLSARSRLLIPYVVESLAKNIPLAIFLFSLDEKGDLMNRPEIIASVQEPLIKMGFTVFSIDGVDAQHFQSLNETEAIKALKVLAPPQAKRIAFGTFKVSQMSQEGKFFRTNTTGTMKVVELADEKLVFNKTISRLFMASNRSSATDLALGQLGHDFGTALTIELP